MIEAQITTSANVNISDKINMNKAMIFETYIDFLNKDFINT